MQHLVVEQVLLGIFAGQHPIQGLSIIVDDDLEFSRLVFAGVLP